MSTPHFTPEFKEEVIKPVTERRDALAEVSTRLGGSSSLCKRMKAVTLDNSEKSATEPIEAKG